MSTRSIDTYTMDELSTIYDYEIEEMLKAYWGTKELFFEADYVPSTVSNNKFAGLLKNVTLPKSRRTLSYPINGSQLTFKVKVKLEKGRYSFRATLAPRDFRLQINHLVLLNAIPQTIKPTHNIFVSQDKIAKIYKSIREDWKTDEQIAVGVYTFDTSDNSYYLEDIRSKSFTSLSYLDNEEIRIKLDESIKGVEIDQFYEFSWKISIDDSKRGYHLIVDTRQKFKPINPHGLIKKLYDSWDKSDESIADQMKSTMRMISTQLTSSSDGTFLYELLQNANDYPQQKDGKDLPVEVEFHLTKDYLVYRHSGEYFSPRNVAAICKVAAGEKTKKKNAIGYKGIGFKTVFNDHDYVYIKSGDYSFRYDLSQRKSRFNPWQIMPIWTNEEYVSQEISKIFNVDSDIYRVQMAMRPTDHSILRQSPNRNYEYLLKDIFKDVRDIIFIPNVEAVRIYVDGKQVVDCDKRKETGGWIVTETPLNYVFSQEENDKLVNEANINNRIPEKYKEFIDTNVSFACRLKGNVLEGIKEAKIYCYLPTQISFGFSFLMNTDMIPSGARDDIEEGVQFNKDLSEIAGVKFFDWIQGLIKSKQYDYESIFAIIPDFDECIKGRKAYIQDCIRRFQKGFESQLHRAFIPSATGELVTVQELLYDKTRLSDKDLMTDDLFLTISDKKALHLVHKSLRDSSNFRRVIKPLMSSDNIFDWNNLIEACEHEVMQSWLVVQENNNKFLYFILPRMTSFIEKKIFINDRDHSLGTSSSMFYTNDSVNYAMAELPDFVNISRLSHLTIDFFKDSHSWEENRKFWKFMEFTPQLVVDYILSDKFKKEKGEVLYNKQSSIRLIHYIAMNASSLKNISIGEIPFFEEHAEQCVKDGFYGKSVFLPSNDGQALQSKKWFEKEWIYFISSEYLERDTEIVKSYLISKGVRNFTHNIVMSEVLLQPQNHSIINSNINNDLDVSIDFIQYIYTHRPKDETGSFADCNFKDISIGVMLPNGTQTFYLPSDNGVFFEFPSDYREHAWVNEEWLSKLAPKYLTSIIKEDSEKESFLKFLSSTIGIKTPNSSDLFRLYYKNFRNCTDDNMFFSTEEESIDFYHYVVILEKSKPAMIAEKMDFLKALPVFDSQSARFKLNKRSYIYTSSINDIALASWMPEKHLFVLSKKYTENEDCRRFFIRLGFKEYSDASFTDFFFNVITSEEKPTSMPTVVGVTKVFAQLDTKERCVDFHTFMSKNYSLLNDFEKSLLRGIPVYVYGKESLRRLYTGYGSYLLGDDKFGILPRCSSGLLPEIKALDNSFVTQETTSYWKDVMGCVEMDESSLCSWLDGNAAIIARTLQNRASNIEFWTWLFSLGTNMRSKIGKLRSLPVIYNYQNANNETPELIAATSTTEIYMSNPYMGQAQIEDFARKHGKTNFISSIYIREGDNVEDWRRFFKTLGVKDDVKDVIYSIIINDLPTLKDKKFPWLLVDQYSKELADSEKFKELAPKLIQLQVETTTAGVFVPIASALRITVDDYSQKEPFKIVKLTGEISRDYYADENVKNLIIKIADVAQTKKIAELQQWLAAKVNQFLILQDTLSLEDFKDMHFSFIKELFGHVESLDRSKIKLYNREWILTKSDELYLGSKYECKCDFERFGIAKTFVNDDYLELGKANDCSRVLRSIGCQDRFKENDIEYLTNKEFSIYFWCKYVGSKDPTIIGSVNSWVKSGKFNNVACIPPENGEMKRACDLYSSSLSDYMKYIPNYQEKIIDKRMQFTEPLIELCKQCMESLTINDIIAFLINSKPKNKNRTIALQWLLDNQSEEKDVWIDKYLSHEKACWLNGQGEASHISSLMAIDPNNSNQAYVFNSFPRVIDISYFPKDCELKVCSMFKMQVFSDKDLVPKPVKMPDGGQTLMVSKEIIRRLLLVIALRYKYEWEDWFDSLKTKMEDMKFWLCESISYGYEDLSINNEDFYFDRTAKTLYYVDSWQDKKVYESFVKNLCEYLDMDLDYRECKGKLDENFRGRKVANYLNQNCKDLYNDESFVSVVKLYWSDIVEYLDIVRTEEIEEEDENEIEDIEKYYEEEIDEEQQQEQMDDTESQNNSAKEEARNGASDLNSQTTPPSEEATERQNTYNNSNSASSTNSASSVNGPQKSNEERLHEESKTSVNTQTASNSRSESSSGSHDSGSNTSRQGSSSSQRQRKPNFEPKTPTEEEIRRFKYQSSTKSFTTEDMRNDEYEALNKILGGGLSAEEIVTENYLAQLRFWNSLKENGFDPEDSVSMEDFIRNNKDDQDYELANGKYIHRCSARGGILHISPAIWNMVTDDRCIICVFVGAKVNEFFYIHNKKELLDWISEDAIVIKLTGSEKVEAVNRLYSEILLGTKGTAYTLIRVAYNESYNSLFSDIESNDFSQSEFDEGDYGD